MVLKAGKGSLDIYLYQLYQEPCKGTDGAQPCPPPALTGLGVSTLSPRFPAEKKKTNKSLPRGARRSREHTQQVLHEQKSSHV